MSRLLVNDVHLNFEVAGSGPAVVALHGFAGNMATWSALAREMEREFTFVLVDLLGHGASDCPAEPARYGLERVAADIACLLDRLRIRRACWLGYSMGGRLALVAAATLPDRFAALILEGASPGLADPREREERARSDAAIARCIEEKGIGAFADFWEALPLFATQRDLPREIRDFVRRQRLGCDRRGLANTLRGASPGVQPPVHEWLQTLAFPVLCVAGELDQKFTAIAREMSQVLPDGRLAVIPGAGHCAHLERPREFCQAVLDFLTRLPPWDRLPAERDL